MQPLSARTCPVARGASRPLSGVGAAAACVARVSSPLEGSCLQLSGTHGNVGSGNEKACDWLGAPAHLVGRTSSAAPRRLRAGRTARCSKLVDGAVAPAVAAAAAVAARFARGDAAPLAMPLLAGIAADGAAQTLIVAPCRRLTLTRSSGPMAPPCFHV